MSDSNPRLRISELETDNAKLRDLLRQRDPSNRAIEALALLRRVVRDSALTPRNLDDYVAHLQDRLAAISRTHAAVSVRGFVDLHDLLAEELLQYDLREGEAVSLSGPAVHLTIDAGQLLALAVHELAVNGIEHGALARGPTDLKVHWRVSGAGGPRILEFFWDEPNPAHASIEKQGFGFGILTILVPGQLGGTAKLGGDGDRFAYSLSAPLIAEFALLPDLLAAD